MDWMDSDIIDDNDFIHFINIVITIDSANIVVGTVDGYDLIIDYVHIAVINIVVNNMLVGFYFNIDDYILFDDLIIYNSFSLVNDILYYVIIVVVDIVFNWIAKHWHGFMKDIIEGQYHLGTFARINLWLFDLYCSI